MARKRRSPRKHTVHTKHPRYKVPQYLRGKTLFTPAKYKKYSEIVSFENPNEARKSALKLEKEFRRAKTRKKKLRILSVLRLSANRAKATLNRKNLSKKEQSEFHQIWTIYNSTYNLLRKDYPTSMDGIRRAHYPDDIVAGKDWPKYRVWFTDTKTGFEIFETVKARSPSHAKEVAKKRLMKRSPKLELMHRHTDVIYE